MDDVLNRALRVALFFVASCLLVWALFPAWKTLAAGLILGTLTSVMNALLLRRRVDLISRAVAEGQGAKRMSLGLGSRLAMVLLAVMVAYRFPWHFHLIATLAACFLVQMVSLVIAFILNLKRSDGKG
ncbi:ATP synthase subunit I [Paenibacillus ginsengihumi]|uniref:ATP synthase subunit I n=1 Tax=Paenibacillus ginsengihumi TaxID=431596 RepID=UPI00036A2730|nr:ATP synthase subunit I [Paenibacillus ginsengihumi]